MIRDGRAGLTPKQAAQQLKVSLRTVQRLLSAGKITRVGPTKFDRISRKSVYAILRVCLRN